ncbi:MAG TPA: rRNA maturation RNase YbeY [Woeseiaceae bacterium]|nr:rRNA maturation RNase YbeY [Woeseiaceae bacterium]
MGAVGAAEIDIQVASDAPGIPDATDIRHWIRAALDGAGRSGAHEIAVRIVDADEMRALNREFRGQDRPTNVLSFPMDSLAGLPAGVSRALGDLVVCAPVVHDEALAQGKPQGDHWAHILVHGSLHLLGFDHVEAAAAAAMETLEVRILAAEGIPDPYGER